MSHQPSASSGAAGGGGYFPSAQQHQQNQQPPRHSYVAPDLNEEDEEDDGQDEDHYTPAPKRGGAQRKGSCWPKVDDDVSPGTESPPRDLDDDDSGNQQTPRMGQNQQQWQPPSSHLPPPAPVHHQQHQQQQYQQPYPPHLQPYPNQQPQYAPGPGQPIYAPYGSGPPPPPTQQQSYAHSPYYQYAQQPQQMSPAGYAFPSQPPSSNHSTPRKPAPSPQPQGFYQHDEDSDQTLHDVDLDHQPGQGKSGGNKTKSQLSQRKGRRGSDETDDDDDRDRRRGGGGHKKPSRDDDGGRMARRPTTQLENGDEEREREEDSYRIKGGILSQLMRGLTSSGQHHSHKVKRTSSSASQMSRASSTATSMTGVGGRGGADMPTMTKLGFRARSDSLAGAWFNEPLDPDDPRNTGVVSKKLYAPAAGQGEKDGGRRKSGARRASIQYHVADILERHNFVLKLARALMVFGAPSHRIESQLNATARVLEIDAQFIHFPNIVIASFGDQDTKTSETHFVKAASALELGKLHRVHNAYRKVVHDEISVMDGTQLLNAELKSPPQYGLFQRMAIASCCSALICPLAFGGSFIDAFAAGASGCLLAFLQLYVAKQNAMYSNIFEITAAMVISFVARGLATTNIFCYQSVASAGVVLILPGYAILCGSLELASKNLIGGSVRMVYAIIYSLFLGFGIAIGSDFFFLVDPSARRANLAAAKAANQMITVMGQFVPDNQNGTSPMFSGSFVFSNHTAGEADQYQKGNVACFRDADAPWWRHDVSHWWLFLLVPCFSLSLSLWNAQPFKSKQLPVMVFISCVSFVANMAANHYIFNRSDVVSCIGAFVVGLLGNLYSRVFRGTAFTAMVTGVLFLVPSGIAAAGGLAMTIPGGSDGDSYSQGLIIGFRMVQVAIGITVGLFGSGLVVYSFGSKKGAALFAF